MAAVTRAIAALVSRAVRQEPATYLRFQIYDLRFSPKPCASQNSPLTSSMILLN